MILIINTAKEKLHSLEFVKPVGDILAKNNCRFVTKHYLKLTQSDFNKADKIIITGTSLKDNTFLGDIDRFSWIRDTNKPILGICAGMHIIGKVFKGALKKQTEIGLYEEEFERFLGLEGKEKVYHLHKLYIDFEGLNDFYILNKGSIAQAVKHKTKEIYGCLFHPEVRQKELILNFLQL